MGKLDSLWLRTHILSKIIRTSDLVRFYSGIMAPRPIGQSRSQLRRAVEHVIAKGGNPPHSLHFVESMIRNAYVITSEQQDIEQINNTPDGERFLQVGRRISRASIMIIEWLRSRMPGYPFRDLPHVHSWSNLSCRDSFFYLGVPWLPELRNLKLETHAEPPGMIASDLGISLINTEPFIRTLQRISSTLGESATWKSLEDSISRLEAEDKATLKECYRRFHGQLRPHVVYPEGGSSVRSRYKYRDSVLKEIARALNDRTNQYFHCFEQANEVLAVLFYLLSTFVIDGCIKHYHEYDSLMVYPGKTAVSTKLVEMTVTVDMDVRKFHRFFYLEDEMPSLSGLMFIAGHSWGTSKEKLAAYLLNDSRDAIDKDTFQYIG